MARLGVFCLMGLAIALARLVEVELRPERLVVEMPAAAVGAGALPPVEIVPEGEQAIAAPPPAPAPPPETLYEVQPGDTLDKISQRVYGTRKHWREILKANQEAIPDPRKMRAGVRLKIPTLSSDVRAGRTS